MEKHPQRLFALCGSSARKLKRSGVDLLAGRALTINMEGFSWAELQADWNTPSALEWGTLPLVQRNPQEAARVLSAYVHTYIKEEIREEGIVRQTPPFLRFLAIAGQLNGQAINGANIAREAAISRSSVDSYFSILSDTLLSHWLPAYQPKLKVRERAHPKFYWFDPGVARAAAGQLFDPLDNATRGFSLETLVYHELRVYNETRQRFRPLSYYRTAAGAEIDFLIETQPRRQNVNAHVVAIEVKLATRWNRSWEKAICDLHSQDGIHVDRMIGIYLGEQPYHFDGFSVLPLREFLKELHAGRIF